MPQGGFHLNRSAILEVPYASRTVPYTLLLTSVIIRSVALSINDSHKYISKHVFIYARTSILIHSVPRV